MPLFRFTAIDAEGRTIQDQIDAVSADAALAMLASQQLRVEDLEPVEQHSESQPSASDRSQSEKLSRSEAEQLTAHVADLTKADLPLGPGLRRLAGDLPRGRLSLALLSLAAELDRGASLEESLDRLSATMPGHLHGLISAGLRSGRLAEVLSDYAIREQVGRDYWRQARLALAYPLLALLLLGSITLVFAVWIVPMFVAIFTDFGLEVPEVTKAVIWTCQKGLPWLVLIGIILLIVLPLLRFVSASWLLDRCWLTVPFLGAAWNWASLSEFARLLRLLIAHDIPLPEALDYTAAGMRDMTLRRACGELRESTAAGHQLSAGVAAQRRFPAGLGPLLAWGERTGSLPDALDIAATAYEDRVRLQVELLKSVLPPIVFILVAGLASLGLTAMFLPLVKLISSLS